MKNLKTGYTFIMDNHSLYLNYILSYLNLKIYKFKKI